MTAGQRGTTETTKEMCKDLENPAQDELGKGFSAKGKKAYKRGSASDTFLDETTARRGAGRIKKLVIVKSERGH